MLLAFAEPDLQENVLNGRLTRFTERTIVDPPQLRRKLAEIRLTGVAVAHGQISLHHTAVAVPVHDATGVVCAAISVVVESGTAWPRQLEAVLQQASRSITVAMSPPP